MIFIKPSRNLVEKSKSYSYINPIIGIVYWRKLKDVFNYLKKKRWEQILEIGCGFGFLLPSLCQIGSRVIGCDIESAFNVCEKTTLREFEKRYANLELKKIDARSLSNYIDENSCDVIIAISVLEHIDDYNRAIMEIRKCLKPNGIFVSVLPSENWLYMLGRKLVGYKGDYHKHYDYEKMQSSLRRNFKEVKKRHSPFGIPLFVMGAYAKKTFEEN
jgi:2-polyprenyl-3-methyl-5-hydroxy-6-metoxy-1,4-benzoquinol methylase